MTDKTDLESKAVEAPPPPPPPATTGANLFTVDVALRVLLFAAALVSVVVMSTAKQTELASVPGVPGVTVSLTAKFKHSPAFIYFVAALSVVGFYSIITSLASISVILKPNYQTLFSLLFVLGDVVALGLVASATGTAGGVAYIGLKGNSHVGWTKVCNVYDKFCRHIGSAVAVSLFGAVVLVALIFLSIFSIHRKIGK
ncbi:CASP-like protein 1D1 [Tripterygium wilfordii]|uniref:CASP-like protein n=1 Tax=Tripterygium wilfordii TaxID=458696 RepID=A0A7J7CS65_TRIWF|nr:CASP-like protein 1D1 [Tripterygium wilfordii]XP_038724242.1 CASP-like protein 1D1 [Tripterygium wilfordii]KAF5736935.1 CASP-like protein 1D1 [Tripterygium wilfordii]KAF5736945.1 CASP-like protein 1D1 [Tripterygium wilfordii]